MIDGTAVDYSNHIGGLVIMFEQYKQHNRPLCAMTVADR
jgi:hypothetical protein